MTIAVVLDDGTPWAVPVKIQLQWGNAFEWDSKLDAEHSQAIAKRPDISISLYQKTATFIPECTSKQRQSSSKTTVMAMGATGHSPNRSGSTTRAS